MWEHIGILVAYALIVGLWTDGRRRDRQQEARITAMELQMNGYQQERLELQTAIKSFRSTIADTYKPIQEHLDKQDGILRELKSLAVDQGNQLASLRKGNLPH